MFFKAKTINEQDVKKALADAIGDTPIISGVVIKPAGKKANVTIIYEEAAPDETLKTKTEQVLRALKGTGAVHVIFTGPAAQKKPDSYALHDKKKAPLEVTHLGKIIAVFSGKGGVGKSTIAANLAVALSQKNLRVGLLDADVFGPSVPRLFGLNQRPETRDKKLVPLEKHNLKIMSIGFMLDEDKPVIWRGAMVHSAIKQLIGDVDWGTLDALVVDMPPGTGDVQLTLAQNVPIAGGIIVSTPQDLALIDARKAIAMFVRMEVPILGLIENMSSFICPHCGGESHIFSHGGARTEAAKIGVDFLGEIPLTLALRESADAGMPLAACQPETALAQQFQHIAGHVWQKMVK